MIKYRDIVDNPAIHGNFWVTRHNPQDRGINSQNIADNPAHVVMCGGQDITHTHHASSVIYSTQVTVGLSLIVPRGLLTQRLMSAALEFTQNNGRIRRSAWLQKGMKAYNIISSCTYCVHSQVCGQKIRIHGYCTVNSVLNARMGFNVCKQITSRTE